MGDETPRAGASTAGAVFLSYASQDQDAAQRICDALRAAGVEVWLDKSELRGGDAWDATIRKQIKTCALFIPVISRSTHARSEGYFRLEWKLAVDRSHLMAANKAFLVPVVIDDTAQDDDAVPDRFREVHWTRLPDGQASPAFAATVARLLLPEERSTAPAGTAAASSPGTPPLFRSKLFWALCSTAILIVASIAAGRFVLSRRPPAMASAPSIAVLPFVDMSEQHDQEYFSDGLAEELLDTLAKTPGLRVIARTSSFYFKGKQATVPEIGRALAVTNLLEGSVRKSGNHLRVTTQLVRADNGEHLWSETYDRDEADLFKIQDDIARAVVDKLRLTLLGNEIQRPQATATNPQAHNLYLQGRYLQAFDTEEGLAKASENYQKALGIDPNYALAWAGVASAAFRQVANGYGSIDEGITKEGHAAHKAVELGPNLAEAYVQLGLWREAAHFDWDGTRQDINHALQLEPSNSEAQFALAHITLLDDVEKSARLRQAAIEHDPLNLLQRRYLGRTQYWAGHLDEAEATIRQVLAMNPSLPAAHYELGRILLARGQVPQAVSEFESEKSDWRRSGVPLGYHAAGRTAEANAALQRLLANTVGIEFQAAEAEAYFGNLDAAFARLDRAVQFRDPGIQWIIGDPLLRNLTQDPRYAALMQRLNLRK